MMQMSGVMLVTGKVEEIGGIDQVVFAIERDRRLIEEVSSGSTEQLGIELYVIGDAVWPREPHKAVPDGAKAGRAIQRSANLGGQLSH